jgi:hypothetical protein
MRHFLCGGIGVGEAFPAVPSTLFPRVLSHAYAGDVVPGVAMVTEDKRVFTSKVGFATYPTFGIGKVTVGALPASSRGHVKIYAGLVIAAIACAAGYQVVITSCVCSTLPANGVQFIGF